MRVLVAALAVTALATPAAADSFVEVAGGAMIPVGDEDWTDYVESGPKVAARVGTLGPQVGGSFSIDWTPLENTEVLGDITAHRFRFVVSAMSQRQIAPKVFATFRAGAGLDLLRVNADLGVFGEYTETDPGLAIEAAVGIWVPLGGLSVGADVVLPVSFHADGSDNMVDLNDYSSVDIDVMFGVRFVSSAGN